jgi:hypothetical protein
MEWEIHGQPKYLGLAMAIWRLSIWPFMRNHLMHRTNSYWVRYATLLSFLGYADSRFQRSFLAFKVRTSYKTKFIKRTGMLMLYVFVKLGQQ